jgi:hypothetical protein
MVSILVFPKLWRFPYPFGFCNPVRIYGRKINYENDDDGLFGDVGLVCAMVCACVCVCLYVCSWKVLWESRSVGRMSFREFLVMLSLCKWYSLIQSEVGNIVEWQIIQAVFWYTEEVIGKTFIQQLYSILSST